MTHVAILGVAHIASEVVCYTAVFSVVTQRSRGEALRDETKNGCVADYFGSRFFNYSLAVYHLLSHKRH